MTDTTIARPEATARITRGVRRALVGLGYASVVEFPLACGRRADVLAVNDGGEILIVEVKSSIEDFRADQKWPEYQAWCDAFWFAVGPDFPAELIPEDCGLLVADAYGAVVRRDAPVSRLNAARRKSLLTALALCAAGRLHRIEDPSAALDGPGAGGL
ncbi:MmcB family DNA repair protein [Arenibaculum pallidiluteum]|uniref:MmcB family DNA repair protein n=1 Tax=Arenibaculum pallidiluteum TaxID=2812559 RepID=UPI001A95A0BA|nr:MmcB family DNA repair protein [Arenibaculum pallidiluteum]